MRLPTDLGSAIATIAPASSTLPLAEAMVAASSGSLLLLDAKLCVVATSDYFGRAFNLPRGETVGKLVFDLGAGEWELPRFRSLLQAVSGGATVQPYELLFSPRGDDNDAKCLEISAQKLDHDDPDVVRFLVAIADLTESRASKVQTEKLIADKVLLNREVQHRVANSLQIIASVLMQSARRVSSDEVRGHLHQAHDRVMSIAEVQRQLASTGADSVALRPYLTQLCASIAASMIEDPQRLSISVEVDDSEVRSDTSISLGLIVTELVINAVKHGFPDDRSGKIMIDFAGSGPGGSWMLEVADNGVGMPLLSAKPATPGLGTSLIEAIARQQRAQLTTTSRHPGTIVCVKYDPPGAANANVIPLDRAV